MFDNTQNNSTWHQLINGFGANKIIAGQSTGFMGGERHPGCVVAKTDIWMMPLLIGQVCQGIDEKHGFGKVLEAVIPADRQAVPGQLPGRIHDFKMFGNIGFTE